MKRSRLASAAVALTLAGVCVTPAGAEPSTTRVIELEEGATFTATSTSHTTIRFPRRVHLGALRAKIEGDGRIRGFVLRKRGDFEEAHRPIVTNLVIGQCSKPGCRSRSHPLSVTFGTNTSDGLSGIWDLFVVADEAKVSVTFGSHATTRTPVVVDDPVAAEIQTLEPTLHESQSRSVLAAGGFTKLDSVDLALFGMWVIGDRGQATSYGDCFYSEASIVPQEAAFLPGCPGGDGRPHLQEPSPSRSGVIYTSRIHSDLRGAGGWYAVTPPVHRSGAIGFWIDYR